nr:hypothetical protein [uncultured Cohaesibacter sp.]
MTLLNQLWGLILLVAKLWASFQVTNRTQITREGSNSNELDHAYRSKWRYPSSKEEVASLDKTRDDFLLGSDEHDSLHRSDGYRRD